MPHPFKNQDAAKKGVKAHIYESKAASGSGNFECPGLPNAHAGAPVIVSGFGTGIDGEWKAESVEKSITAQGGFTTTVNVNAGKEQKGAKS